MFSFISQPHSPSLFSSFSPFVPPSPSSPPPLSSCPSLSSLPASTSSTTTSAGVEEKKKGEKRRREVTEEEKKGIEDSSEVLELTEKTFFERIKKEGGELWLVEFSAPWCGFCKKLSPVWNLLAKRLKGKVKVGVVDITKEDQLNVLFAPKYLPTICLFKESSFYLFSGEREIPDFEAFVEGDYLQVEAKSIPFPHLKDPNLDFLLTLSDSTFF